MPGSEDSTVDFEYGGYLLFNGIYNTNFYNRESQLSRSNALSLLSDYLHDYDRTDARRDDGYKRILVSEGMYDSPNVEEELTPIAPPLISYRYLYEKRSDAEAYYQGERVQVELPNIKDADLYWLYPDYVFLRGAKEDVNETRETTFRILSDEIRLESIDFSGEFLLWLYYKHVEGHTIPTGVDIENFTDGVVSGDRDPFGRTNTIDDSTNLEQCVPIIVGVLKGKSISLIEGYFRLYDNFLVKSQISNQNGQGRVHVKASEGAISHTRSDIRRISIALNFVRELVELHNHWDALPPSEKYPPFSFFEGLYETALDQGIDIESIPDDVLRKYARLREEDTNEWT